jgi:hypothetical protein
MVSLFVDQKVGVEAGPERLHRRPMDYGITQPRTLMIKERRVCIFSNLEKPSMGDDIVVSRAFSVNHCSQIEPVR